MNRFYFTPRILDCEVTDTSAPRRSHCSTRWKGLAVDSRTPVAGCPSRAAEPRCTDGDRCVRSAVEVREWLARRRGGQQPRGKWCLPRVRRALSRVVGGPGDPPADVDRADVDDLRRPRRARRLEHLAHLARADGAKATGGTKRIRAGLASYRAYQHIGNLGPEELARTPHYRQVAEAGGDAQGLLEDFAEGADKERDGREPPLKLPPRLRPHPAVGDRHPERPDPRRRAPHRRLRGIRLNRGERRGHVDHLLIGSSLPWLMPHALSHFQSLDERAASLPGWCGRHGEKARRAAEMGIGPRSARRSNGRRG